MSNFLYENYAYLFVALNLTVLHKFCSYQVQALLEEWISTRTFYDKWSIEVPVMYIFSVLLISVYCVISCLYLVG